MAPFLITSAVWLVIVLVFVDTVQHCGALPKSPAIGETTGTRSGLQELRSAQLNPNYFVEWQTDFDQNLINFWVLAKTPGYIGFGLSTTGQMKGADIVIGGIREDGKMYFHDYHGVGNRKPILDENQDWVCMEVTKNSTTGWTLLHFSRKLVSCDDHDVEITDGTIKIIWSLGATDDLEQPHISRGAHAVNILDPPLPPVDLSSFQSVNFTSRIPLPPVDTFYWCSIHQRKRMPSSAPGGGGGKTHVVGFSPKFDTPEALKFTHHFNIYNCKAGPGLNPVEFFGPHVGTGESCTDPKKLKQVMSQCYMNMYAWSLGGGKTIFPEEIGFPWGFEETEFFMMEIHLDNKHLEALEVETGVTVYHTENLRPIEAGQLSLGHVTSPSLMIPPSTVDWTVAGHCSPACTRRSLSEAGIYIFNINMHAHMSGRKMKIRHFRGDTELPWIGHDATYENDYQENRPLVNPVHVRQGDQITYECNYDSTWKKTNEAVIGGIRTVDEMCTVFAYYYPRGQLEMCFSGFPTKKILGHFNITRVSKQIGSQDRIVREPSHWENRTYTQILNEVVNWTDEMRLGLNQMLRYGDHNDFCYTKEDGGNNVTQSWAEEDDTLEKNGQYIRYPDIPTQNQFLPSTPDCAGKLFETEPLSSTSGAHPLPGGNLSCFVIFLCVFLCKIY